MRAFRRAKDANIVHIHWILNGIHGVPLGKIFRKPIVINVYRVVASGKLMKFLTKLIVKRADYMIFNSSYTRDALLKVIQPKRYCVLPCTIDIEKFTLGPEAN
ncbi:MAG: glycosyltransferase family 4 protein [candidate division KSB1 bacterium]|nr:glycosyltransferase family 4 protein [candidate division KSB1 bacterium]MDZ7333753.1 glycosyltransferase family 4 protein [candidate division KSB1 bacterium]MDZ7357038.1 glycosyltransferase family 4 protein [candidate division KSB1 bacterium]MDZ7398821.1 glycosyltransferase family 4 protein [candidate division KSB1 bacterium]